MAREYGIGFDSESFRAGARGDHGARLLVEQLRYMGVVSNREGLSRFIVPAPRGVTARDSHGWALRNMSRIASFSIPCRLVSRDTRGGEWEIERTGPAMPTADVGETYLYPRSVPATDAAGGDDPGGIDSTIIGT